MNLSDICLVLSFWGLSPVLYQLLRFSYRITPHLDSNYFLLIFMLSLKIIIFLIMVDDNVWSIVLLFVYIRSYLSLILIVSCLVFKIFLCYPFYVPFSCNWKRVFTIFKGLLILLRIYFNLRYSVCDPISSILAAVSVRAFIMLYFS